MELIIKLILFVTYILSLYFSVFWLMTLIEKNSHVRNDHKPRKNPAKFPFVSIIIPAYNEESGIVATIRSVINLDYPNDKYEIIVINDGSKDKTKERIDALLKEKLPVKVVAEHRENQGKAASLNYGIDIAKGEFFACLDADSVVDKKTLKKMVHYFQEHDDRLAIVTPAMKVAKTNTIIQKFQRVEYIMSVFIQRLMGYIDCIYVAPGPFSLYRKKTIQELGGFEVGNLTEDQEIAYRAQAHHYKIRQCPHAFVHTNAPKNVRELYKQRNRWFKGSLFNIFKYRRMFMNKEYGDFGLFQLPLNVCSYLLSVAALGVFVYLIGLPLVKAAKNLFLINFDIVVYLRDLFSGSFSVLNLDLGTLFIVYFTFGVTLYLFYISHHFSSERVRDKGVIYLVPYFFLYYVLLSVFSVIVLFEVAVGKKQKW